MTHPGTPRDVNLDEWLNAAGFHPANTPMKQMGHEAARVLVGLLGKHLHRLLPASREKSVVFAHLEQARHYANQALAVHGGPPASVDADDLAALLADSKRIADEIGATLPEDPRVGEYKAEQVATPASPHVPDWPSSPMSDLPAEVRQYLPEVVADQMSPRLADVDPELVTRLRAMADRWGALGVAKVALMLAGNPELRVPLAEQVPDDPAEASDWLDAINAAVNAKHPGTGWAPQPVVEKPFTHLEYSTGDEPDMTRRIGVAYSVDPYDGPLARVRVEEHHEAENERAAATIEIHDPDVLEELAAGFLAAANRVRRDRA